MSDRKFWQGKGRIRSVEFLGIGLALTLLLACSACFSWNVQNQGLLRVQLSAEPVSLDPSLAEDGVSLQVLNQVMEGLVGNDSDGKLENRLASEVETLKNGLEIRFTLRKGALWSDGKPVEVQDFVLAFQRALSPTTLGKLAPLFYPIRGARAYHEGKTAELGVFEKAGKLVIQLEHPAPYLIQALTLSIAFPVRADILNQNGGKWPETAPVTGPFRVLTHLVDEKIVLERNPRYWGEKAKLDQIEFLIVADETTAIRLFDQGKLDLLTRVSSLDFARLKKAGRIHTTPFLATYYLSFDCRKPPFQNRDWRRAVAGAIRREEIAQVLEAGEMAASSWIPRGLEGFEPFQNPRPLFADSIQKVISEVRGANPSRVIQAGFDASSRNSRVMEKIEQDLFRELGVHLSLSPLDWRAYVKSLAVDPPQIFRFGRMAPFSDPIVHLKGLTSSDLNNYSGCHVDRYDHLVEEIERMVPGSRREKKILQAQKIIVEEEAVVVPIYHYVQNTAFSTRVDGLQVSPQGLILLSQIFLRGHSK